MLKEKKSSQSKAIRDYLESLQDVNDPKNPRSDKEKQAEVDELTAHLDNSPTGFANLLAELDGIMPRSDNLLNRLDTLLDEPKDVDL